MIRCTSVSGKIINVLADRGEITPVVITWPGTDRKSVECNSIWAATDYLKSNGFYDTGKPSGHVIV